MLNTYNKEQNELSSEIVHEDALIKALQKELEDYDANIWEDCKKKSTLYIQHFKEKTKVLLKPQQDLYFLHCPVGDIHLGHDGVDYERAELDAKLIGSCSYARAYNIGDSIDNFIKGKILDAIISATTTPKQQIKLLSQYLEFFNGNLILMIGGNHSFIEGTELLTDNGFKKIQDITLNDNVAQYDIESKEISYINPLKLHKHFESDFIEIESTQHKQIVTLGHDVIYKAEKIKAIDLIGRMDLDQRFLPAFPSKYVYPTGKIRVEKKLLNNWAYCVTVPKGALVTRIDGKIAISGNCRWTKKVSGLDWLAPFTQEHGVMYSPDEFNVFFEYASGIKYYFKLRHQYKYKSVYNITHSLKQMLRFSDTEDLFDVGVTGHDHNVALEQVPMFGSLRTFVKSGTYKVADPFALECGFPEGKSLFPCWVTSPREKCIVPFFYLQDGIDFVNMKNKEIIV
jgi:hypothetical protein